MNQNTRFLYIDLSLYSVSLSSSKTYRNLNEFALALNPYSMTKFTLKSLFLNFKERRQRLVNSSVVA